MCLFFDRMFNFLFRKCDASSLAVIRIIVGTFLLFDMVHERGLSRADIIWGDPNECRFPLFDGLLLLPMREMFAIYLLMFIGNVGIILGLYYKLSCLIYLSCYWYLFLLDKSRWNNHSYLFGLLVLLLSISDANYQWSFDNYLRKSKSRRVPFWQYFLLRSQIFLVYFIAGLKKFDTDWLNGYSMNISEHWVFSPFRLVLTNQLIDFYVVHWGGFLFDLMVGFFLIFSKSRPIAYLFCILFNLMNSRIFSIGMFPYMMIGVMTVFSDHDWPIQLITKLNTIIGKRNIKPKSSYQDQCQQLKNDESVEKTKKQRITLTLVVIYLMIQIVLPHSHWLTKGYNTWTNGLYGYSWDMMVHNWKHIHTRVTVVDKLNRKFYLNPEAWTQSFRWSHHSDMVKQYALCAHKRLTTEFNITEPSIYIDSWISLNGRFAQRVYDPRVDIVTAKWTPFERPEWVLPVLSHLAEWRPKMRAFEQNIYEENEDKDNSLVFIADFPGLSLSNYIGTDFENTTLIVLKGWLKIEIEGQSVRMMSSGDKIHVPTKRFHRLSPIKSEPAAYVFIFANNSQQIPNEVYFRQMSDKQNSDSNKFENPWIRRNIWEGLKVLLEITVKMCLTLFKRFFICLNMCQILS